MLGMHGTVYANYAINEADLLLAFGVRFDDRVTGKVSEFAKHGKIVHIDIDPSEINKNKVGHICRSSATCGQALADLIAADGREERRPGRRRPLRRLDAADRALARDRAAAVRRPRRRDHAAVRHRAAVARSSATAASSTTRSSRPASASIRCGRPSTSTSTRRGTGSPAAAWARWASACPRRWARRRPIPTRLVIDIDGDGSFLMNIQELATAYCEKLPVKVLLLNNQHLGMVVQWEDRFYGGNRGHTYLGAGYDQRAVPRLRDDRQGLRRAAPAASPTRTTSTTPWRR